MGPSPIGYDLEVKEAVTLLFTFLIIIAIIGTVGNYLHKKGNLWKILDTNIRDLLGFKKNKDSH
jgi:hypothetical protein